MIRLKEKGDPMHRAHTVCTVHAGLKAFYVKNHIKKCMVPYSTC